MVESDGSEEAAEAVENLLESYFMQIDGTYDRLVSIGQYLCDSISAFSILCVIAVASLAICLTLHDLLDSQSVMDCTHSIYLNTLRAWKHSAA